MLRGQREERCWTCVVPSRQRRGRWGRFGGGKPQRHHAIDSARGVARVRNRGVPATLLPTMTALPATPGSASAPLRAGTAPLPVRSAILGLGSYVPADVLTNADMERLVDTSDRSILQRTRVRE